MSTIVTRAGKGSALTHDEVDANFNNLNTDKIQSGNTVAALTITSATINGGTISGITDIAIADGGTGASTATAAFNALSPVTTKGDIIVRNGTDNIRLAVGTNDQVLTADSAQASGVKWAAIPASGGMTLLGTLTTTSGSSQALTSLDLTTYKQLLISYNNVSSSSNFALTLNSIAVYASTASTISNTQSIWGMTLVDLNLSSFSTNASNAISSTGTVSSLVSSEACGNCGITTASTSLTFAVSAGTFDAGSISVYGVK